MTRLRLILVVCACSLFWAVIGLLLGLCVRHPLGGFVWGLLFGIAYVVFGSLAADKYPGAVWDARLLENINAPHLYDMLRALCARTGLALPTLYYIPRPEPNAFVTAGRDGETSVFVSTGLTRQLEKDEVQAVMALMMARLATGAMPAWTTAATLAGLPLHAGLYWQRREKLVWLGNVVLTVFGRPSAALAQLAWDPGIVTAADFHAAHLAEQAGSLERALSKIEAGLTEEGAEAGNPATALLFAVPPLPAHTVGTPLWRRGLKPFRSGILTQPRGALLFADVVPSYVPEPEPEFRIF